MCGIAGGIFESPSFDSQNLLDVFSSALRHRGPDGSGHYYALDNTVLLFHSRLAILELSNSGSQPMHSGCGRYVITFNGEIYNYRSLKRQLLELGYVFTGDSDTEVLLYSWIHWGEDCLPMLNGMFAFAIWDSSSRSLVLARDRSGIKPLFFSNLDDGLLFASEVVALAPLLPSLHQLQADTLLRQLCYLWCPGPSTMHPLIQSLEPGSLLKCTSDKTVSKRRWCKPVPPRLPSLDHSSVAVQATLDHLRTAVHRQMVADVPLGAFLSGGLDSSAIVALAKELKPQIQCFTVVNSGVADPGFVDDLPYARLAARYLGVPLTEVEIQPSDLSCDLRWLLAQFDSPVPDPAPLNVFHIARVARAQGIKVLLSGAGGDDLFTGYRRHLALQAEALWHWWPRSWRRYLRLTTSRFHQSSSLLRRLARTFEMADADPEQRLIQYFRWGTPSQIRSLLSEPLQQQLLDTTASQPFFDWLRQLPPGLSRLQQTLALEQRFFLADHNLHYTDVMSMAAGVEVRVPFLDHDLLDLSWRLPDRFKQRGRSGKWVLKQAMTGLLPQDIIHRPKTGFGAPLRRWLEHDLHELVHSTLSSHRVAVDGLFSPSAVTQLLDDHFTGRRDHSYTIWSLLCISLWWERQQERVV